MRARLRFYLPLLVVANFVRLWGARRAGVSLVWLLMSRVLFSLSDVLVFFWFGFLLFVGGFVRGLPSPIPSRGGQSDSLSIHVLGPLYSGRRTASVIGPISLDRNLFHTLVFIAPGSSNR